MADRRTKRVFRRERTDIRFPLWRKKVDGSVFFERAILVPKAFEAQWGIPTKHYEFALTRTDGSVHHFYYEPFHRSNHFLRLQTSVPNTGPELFTDRSPNHSSLVLLRNREWWGDQPGNNDELTLNGLNIATPLIVPRVGVPAPRGTNLAVFAFDRGSDGVTNLAAGELFPFNTLTFLTAADVLVPTAPAGSIAITMTPRGGQHTVQLNVPNWPSTTDRITVQFHDYVQGAYAFTEYRAGSAGEIAGDDGVLGRRPVCP